MWILYSAFDAFVTKSCNVRRFAPKNCDVRFVRQSALVSLANVRAICSFPDKRQCIKSRKCKTASSGYLLPKDLITDKSESQCSNSVLLERLRPMKNVQNHYTHVCLNHSSFQINYLVLLVLTSLICYR